MPDLLDPLSDRARRMTDAYSVGIEITEQLRAGDSLPSGIGKSSIRTALPADAYPEWHPALHSFLGKIRLLVYRETTGDSCRT